jgi:hypothetical protein
MGMEVEMKGGESWGKVVEGGVIPWKAASWARIWSKSCFLNRAPTFCPTVSKTAVCMKVATAPTVNMPAIDMLIDVISCMVVGL